MERESSNSIAIDLDKLSLELGRDPDVDDLDDDGWFAASKAKRIIELGTLGEGAGGAVTRCKLQGGKTVFALKVLFRSTTFFHMSDLHPSDHYYGPRPGRAEANPTRARL